MIIDDQTGMLNRLSGCAKGGCSGTAGRSARAAGAGGAGAARGGRAGGGRVCAGVPRRAGLPAGRRQAALAGVGLLAAPLHLIAGRGTSLAVVKRRSCKTVCAFEETAKCNHVSIQG